MSDSLQPTDRNLPGSCLWDSPGKNTGVGCHALLQEIFLIKTGKGLDRALEEFKESQGSWHLVVQEEKFEIRLERG